MVIRKITIDNRVRYIPKSEQTKERDDKPKTTKACSVPRKQNKKKFTKHKKFPNNVLTSGFKLLK